MYILEKKRTIVFGVSLSRLLCFDLGNKQRIADGGRGQKEWNLFVSLGGERNRELMPELAVQEQMG